MSRRDLNIHTCNIVVKFAWRLILYTFACFFFQREDQGKGI